MVLATPTTLMALLTGGRLRLAAGAIDRACRGGRPVGKDLYERMAVLAEHVNDVGQALGKERVGL